MVDAPFTQFKKKYYEKSLHNLTIFRLKILSYMVHETTSTCISKKEEIWLSPMTKALTPAENSKTAIIVTTQKRHQKLRLHNDCGPT